MIADELKATQERIAALQKDVDKIDDALAALDGKRAKAKPRSRTKKPTPLVDELREYVRATRQQNPSVDPTRLEKQVRAYVKKAGKSLAGFAPLYQKALAQAGRPFVVAPRPPEGFGQGLTL